jgi:arabinofuranosyltransferase
MNHSERTSKRWIWRALPLLVFALLLVRTAWVCDDAYITFRTVDNFLHGHGLRWNVFERVQVYTHPLWMMCMTALVFVTREFYVTGLVFSMLLSLAALGHLAFRMASSTAAALAVSALLLSSKAFVEYSTSGLENPLSNLLLVLFIGLYLSNRKLGWLALLACLGTLNRMDTVLFYAPALALELWRARSWRSVGTVALGFAPMIAWESFSLVYYGFFFPNTAYAKLSTGIEGADLARQGVQYLLNACEMDPVTIVGILAGLIAPIVLRERRMTPITIGIALYLVYIVKVGGDFMMGRFLAAPLCASASLLIGIAWRPRVAVIAAAVALGLSFVPLRPMFTTGADYGEVPDPSNIQRKVGDQRFMYYLGTGLLKAPKHNWEPVNQWVSEGRALALEDRALKQYGAIGFHGFYAGPRAVIIDYHALSDPLLARLPADERKTFVVAHYKRSLPAGYEASVRTGQNLIEDPDLRVYYDALRKITQDPVWSADRWTAIWEMQTGRLDARITAYAARPR